MTRSNDNLRRVVVLVVEDEPIVLLIAIDIVGEAGFEALQAKNADEAVVILESRGDIRIVFTDIEMPGSMDGIKLAEVIRGRWPPVELLLTSGRRALLDEEIPARGKFLPKPYSAVDVDKALRQPAA